MPSVKVGEISVLYLAKRLGVCPRTLRRWLKGREHTSGGGSDGLKAVMRYLLSLTHEELEQVLKY